MRARYLAVPLLLLLSLSLFTSCGDPLAASSLYELTPIDTSANNLDASITITEDQDATDGTSNIVLQFQTAAVEEANFVRFDDQETAVCNNVLQKLADLQQYQLKVARGNYFCTYTGYQGSIRLSPVTLLDVAARSHLSPQQPVISGQNYTITYAPDPGNLACSIRGEMTDKAGDTFDGPSSMSYQGVYSAPLNSSLTGSGAILLIRTCQWPHLVNTPFAVLDLTYRSLASVEVTWSH